MIGCPANGRFIFCIFTAKQTQSGCVNNYYLPLIWGLIIASLSGDTAVIMAEEPIHVDSNASVPIRCGRR